MALKAYSHAWILLVVLTLALVSTASAAPCDGPRMAIFAVNGVLTSPADSEFNRRLLRRRLSDDLGCEFVVLPAHNASLGVLEDFYESLRQKLAEQGYPSIDAELVQLILQGAIDIRDQNYGALVVHATKFFADEIARNIVELEGETLDPFLQDYNTHLLQ